MTRYRYTSPSYYVYQADVICEDCGLQIRKELADPSVCKEPVNPEDEGTYDSSEFPKGPYSCNFDESDSPSHCGMGDRCVNAEWCPAHGEGSHKIGLFLENRLTSDGYKYVENACKEALAGSGGCVALDIWARFYGISLEEDDNLPKGE